MSILKDERQLSFFWFKAEPEVPEHPRGDAAVPHHVRCAQALVRRHARNRALASGDSRQLTLFGSRPEGT